jgi:hypothetical protein
VPRHSNWSAGVLTYNEIKLDCGLNPKMINPRRAVFALSPSHSHSIVLRHDNVLICQRKFFPDRPKNRIPDPSEICALELKGEFRRSAMGSVSETIDIDRPIFPKS